MEFIRKIRFSRKTI